MSYYGGIGIGSGSGGGFAVDGGGFTDIAKEKARRAKMFAKRGMHRAYESVSGAANDAMDSVSNFATNLATGLIVGGDDDTSSSSSSRRSRDQNHRARVTAGMTSAAVLASIALACVRASIA